LIDAKTKKVVWQIAWGKTKPMWRAISVVELERDGSKQIAIELFATQNRLRELTFRYVDLKTGEPIEIPGPSDEDRPADNGNERPSPQADEGPGQFSAPTQ